LSISIFNDILSELERSRSILNQERTAPSINFLFFAHQAKHAVEGNSSWGVDGETGQVVDMKDYGVWEPYSVKAQTYKTAIETAILLLRIDDIVSGVKKQSELNTPSGPAAVAPEEGGAPGPEH
jgi:T-complex protein 1 subunit gamma